MRFRMYQCEWSACCYKISIQQQHSSSSTTAAVFQALTFVPAVTAWSRCTLVIGAQQEIESRQHFHVQRNNQTHTVGPHARYTKHTAAAKAVAHTHHWSACVPPFRLTTSTGYQVNPIPEGHHELRRNIQRHYILNGKHNYSIRPPFPFMALRVINK